MMQFKSKKIILFIAVIMASALLSSCVEEPVIEQVKMPYTAYQMINQLNNVENVTVDIIDHRDDSVIQGGISLAKNARNAYKDISSGDWIYKMSDANGNVIFNNSGAKMSSYEDAIVLIYGNYDPDPEVSNVSLLYFYNGMTYLNDYFPPADSSIVAFTNASYLSGEDEPWPVSQIELINTATSDTSTIELEDDLTAGQYIRYTIKSGNYDIKFINYNATDDVLTDIVTGNVNITAGKLGFVVMGGARGSESVSAFDESPTNARPK